MGFKGRYVGVVAGQVTDRVLVIRQCPVAFAVDEVFVGQDLVQHQPVQLPVDNFVIPVPVALTSFDFIII